MGKAILLEVQGKTGTAPCPPGGKYCGEFLRPQQPESPTEICMAGIGNRAAAIQARSDGQTVTALGATGAQDSAATTGAGTDKKAMRALAAHHGRLIGTFHVGILG